MSQSHIFRATRALLVAMTAMYASTAGSAGVEDKNAAAIDAVFADMQQPGTPGGTVGIYHQGRLVYSKGYGLADLDHRVPVTANTVFNIASVSKQFTALSIALLARERKLDLNADIRTYLPSLPDVGHPVTVSHLIHHTSGVRDYLAISTLSGRNTNGVLSHEEAINIVQRQRALNFTPGSDYAYSNAGYALLAQIVMEVSAKSLQAFEEERIFRPMGMSRTRVHDHLSTLEPNYAVGYLRGERPGQWKRALYNREVVGPGNILSNAEDLARWAASFAQPKIGDRALIAQLTAPVRLSNGAPIDYGFGLWHESFAGHAAISHSGGVQGYSARMAFFPEGELAIAILANASIDLNPRMDKLVGIFLGEGKPKTVPAVIRPSAIELSALAGHYQSTDGTLLSLEVSNGSLIEIDDGDRRPLTFWADGSFGAGSYGKDRLRAVRTGKNISAIEEVRSGPDAQAPGARHLRIALETPSPESLASISGTYSSDELGSPYHFSVEAGRLMMRSFWFTQPQPFRPTSADRFDAQGEPLSGLSVSIERDTTGRVSAVVLHYPGANALRMPKARSQ